VASEVDELHLVTRDEIIPAAAVLARAFETDPVWSKLFEDLPSDKMAVWFEGPVRYCLKYGRVYATSERLEGLVAVVPGDLSNMTAWRSLRSGTLTMATRMGLQMMRQASRLMRVFQPMDADRKEHMAGREYTYVMIVGVDPEHQGQGFGGKMLRALIEESDRTGVPVYLETETEENLRMYEHFGFELLQVITLPEIELPLWELLREPRRDG